MDRYSHIQFAKGLLKLTGENTGMAYMSILPLVDAEPSYLHRLYCHPIIKAPFMVNCAKIVFGTKSKNKVPQVAEDVYEIKRFREKYDDIINYFNNISENKDIKIDDGFGGMMCIISHSYFDTFNNPVQAFATYSGYCAGQYSLWEKFDYFKFRSVWYEKAAPEICKLTLAEEFWKNSFSSEDLIIGMIHRLANLTKPSLQNDIAIKICKDIGVKTDLDKDVYQFLSLLETSICDNMIKEIGKIDKTALIVEQFPLTNR